MAQDHFDDQTESVHAASDPRAIARKHAAKHHADQSPSQIGPYRILEMLGEGGMGIVYLAEQTSPIHRRVALKIIKAGMDTRQVTARFETEREALALMNHPHVAKVFDAGATETGRPYFVMEFVPGIPITDYCDKHRLSTEERLRIFMDVCHAVQHAHQKGIIHRDIKPSNVLVMVQDEKPVPKVIDFGVAKATQQKLTERTLFTEQGQLIGTPGYMSPEQAEMTALDIDTRTDVYSLGVLLYELLVGALPFDTQWLLRAGFGEIQRIIREVDPPKPSTRLSALGEPRNSVRADVGSARSSDNQKDLPVGDSARSKDRGSLAQIAHSRHTEPKTLIRKLRGDLDWIVMKCLEKDRTRRYDSASAVALELARYLSNEPVLAGPPGFRYRMRKFIVRNRAGVIAGSLVVIVLTLGGASTGAGLIWALHERDRAQQSEVRAITEAARAEAATISFYRQRNIASDQAELAEKEAILARRERNNFKLVVDYMTEVFDHANSLVAQGGNPQILKEMVDKGTERLFASGLASEADLQLRNVTGRAFRALGEYESAARQFREAVSSARAVYGENALEVASTLDNLSVVSRECGRLNASEAAGKEAVAIFRNFNDRNNLELADALSHLAWTMQDLNKFGEAQLLYEEELQLRRQLNPKDDGDIAVTLNNLALVYEDEGNLATAETLYREAITIDLEGPSDVLPGFQKTLKNLVRNLEDQHRQNDAEQLLLLVFARYKSAYGVVHPETQEILKNAIEFFRRHNKFMAADTAFGLMGYRPDWCDEPTIVEVLMEFYQAWDSSEPGKGYAEKAAEWRAKLDEMSKNPNVETSKGREGNEATRQQGNEGDDEKPKRQNSDSNAGNAPSP